MAGNSKKPRKPYRQKWNAGGKLLRHEPWKISGVFGPIESIIDQLDTDGTVLTDDSGAALFVDHVDGDHYRMGPSLRGVTDAFDLHSRRNERPILTNGLAVLYLKLEGRHNIEQRDIDAARRSVSAMRSECAQMTSAYASRLVRDVQIQFELEAVSRPVSRGRAEPQRLAA